MYLVQLMWRSASESKPVHSRYSRLTQAWRTAKPIRIMSAVSNWFRRCTSHELNSLNSIRLMWSTASESIRNGWHYSDRLSRSSRLAEPGITAVDRLWFRRRSSHEPNQIHNLIYGSSVRISADRNLMHFYLLLNSVRLELRSAFESIQPV